MKVDIYRAKNAPGAHERLYVFIPQGENIEKLPSNVLSKTGELTIEKTIDIHPGEKRIALDSDEALKNLTEKGYHLQGSKIERQTPVANTL